MEYQPPHLMAGQHEMELPLDIPAATPVNERTIQHENTILYLAQEGKAIGIPVACGNRNTEDMGSAGGGIAPDIMFRVESCPAGSTRVLGGVEFSGRGEERAREKFGDYASTELRQDCYPEAAVSYNDRAEKVFKKVATELGTTMFTTTKRRLNAHGPFGNDSCWCIKGQKMILS